MEIIDPLLKYLNNNFGFSIDMKTFDNFKYKDKYERLLKILKYLHSGKKTREEIARSFGISQRVLNDDLGVLQSGFEFLGANMKIDKIKRGENTYRSTIHPIFLSMNMSEIYSLTAGIKLLSQGTVFEDSLNRIADLIYMQLSDYAREIIDKQSYISGIGFEGQKMYFRGTDKMMNEEMKPFTYFLKEPVKCEVTYNDGLNKKAITGTLHLLTDKADRFRKVLVKSGDMELEIDMDDIETIKKPSSTFNEEESL